MSALIHSNRVSLGRVGAGLLVLALAAGVEAAPIFDALSSRVSFQAFLADNQGNALPGPTVDLSFTIYNSANVVVAGPIALDDVPIVNGIVDVLIPVSNTTFDGTLRRLGVSVDGAAELSPRIDLAAVPLAYRVDRVENAELTDNVELGTPTTNGSMIVFRASLGGPGVSISGSSAQIETFSSGGRVFWGGSSSDNGGFLNVYQADGGLSLALDGMDGALGGSKITGRNAQGADTLILDSDNGGNGASLLTLRDGTNPTVVVNPNGSGGGAAITLSNSFGNQTMGIDADDSTGGSSNIAFYNILSDGTLLLDADDGDLGARVSIGDEFRETLRLDGRVASGSSGFSRGSEIRMWNGGGTEAIRLEADDSTGSLFRMRNISGIVTVLIDGDGDDRGGVLSLYDGVRETVRLDSSGSGGGGGINLWNNQGTPTVEIDADENDDAAMRLLDTAGNLGVRLSADTVGSAGEISMETDGGNETVEIVANAGGNRGGQMVLRRANGQSTVEIVADETNAQGGQIILRNAAGDATITIDAEHGANGRIITQELEISGGMDLSEWFDVGGEAGAIRPGAVVCIDPKRPGRLVPSCRAYDRTVAGIISGAGGIRPGMMMGQRGHELSGEHAVALSGRVYCLADESGGAIAPGDLLTTSDVPGHCMKVTDAARAHGAIIGKAMSVANDGMVLVLVNLH